jgi:2-polyprenyl-3-methyl-5-hydroxy-6-metoxy-1,4-benzoquinol methylase
VSIPLGTRRAHELISDTYRGLNRRLHQAGDFGFRGDRWAPAVRRIAADHRLRDVLDYGCGQGALKKALDPSWWRLRRGLAVREYDPAISGKDASPAPAELVVCTDVLEHVEPELLDNVLDHLQGLARRLLFLVVATRSAKKTLEDGRNAHLIVEPEAWWRGRLERRLAIVDWRSLEGRFSVLLEPLARPA